MITSFLLVTVVSMTLINGQPYTDTSVKAYGTLAECTQMQKMQERMSTPKMIVKAFCTPVNITYETLK